MSFFTPIVVLLTFFLDSEQDPRSRCIMRTEYFGAFEFLSLVFKGRLRNLSDCFFATRKESAL